MHELASSGNAEIRQLMATDTAINFRSFLQVLLDELPSPPNGLSLDSTRDMVLTDLGSDSLHMVEIQLFIGEYYDVELSCDWFAEKEQTLGDLYEKLIC